jgi:hypothetical protein
MSLKLREHFRSAFTGITTFAATARQPVADQLRMIKQSVPQGFQDLSAAELRCLLPELQDELWEVTYRQELGRHLIEEEDMPWTQTARDRKK